MSEHRPGSPPGPGTAGPGTAGPGTAGPGAAGLGAAVVRGAGAVVAVLGGAAATGIALVVVVRTVTGDGPVSWVLGRASGLTSYVLLVALVSTGLTLSHPGARRWQRPSHAMRLTLHVTLATFTLVFTVLHVIVLATDPFAQVGWAGAVLPFASTYRPVPVTLGVLALWAGLITGITARLAGSVASRVWWPVHKVAAVVLALVWAHSVLAGTDTLVLRWFYLATGALVLGLSVTRYGFRTPTDRIADLTRQMEASTIRHEDAVARPMVRR